MSRKSLTFSQAEAATLLGVSPRTLRGWPDAPRTDEGAYPGPRLLAWYLARQLGDAPDLDAERARLARSQAERTELDVRKRTGELVEWSRIEALNTSTAVMIREAILSIPDRLAAVLTAESDERRVRQLLDSELRAALASLAAAMRKP